MAVQPAQNKGSRNEEEETLRQETNLVGTQTVESEQAPHTLKWVKAAINVPTSYFLKIWQQRNPPAPGDKPKTPPPADLDTLKQQEIAKLEKMVGSLLPAAQGLPDTTKLVSVTEFEDFPPEVIPEPAFQEQALAWLAQSWSTLGLILLALVSLGMLRSMIRSNPNPLPAASEPTVVVAPPQSEDEQEVDEDVATQRRLKRLTGSGKTLRDELSDLVTENPDAAANILKTWIGNIS